MSRLFNWFRLGNQSNANNYNVDDHPKQTTEFQGEPPSVLYITTHGGYDDDVTFNAHMNIKKINAVNFGTCNYLNSTGADNFAKTIIAAIKNGDIINIEDGSKYIRESLQTILPKAIANDVLTQDPYFPIYLNNSDRMYNIMSVNLGEKIRNKTYSVESNERVNANSPYYDSITLLSSENPEIDILRELIVGPTTRNTTQEVSLHNILKHLHETMDIKNLIVIDLACSVTNRSDRYERRYNRTGIPYGGYERKTKRNIKNKGNKGNKKNKKNKGNKKPKGNTKRNRKN